MLARTQQRICRRWILPGLAWALTVAVWAPVHGQEFGQWTWDANVGARGRNFSNARGGQTTSRSRFTDLGLSLGMDGFIVHPAFAHFRVGADFLFSRTNLEKRDNNSLGLNAALDLFPTGAVPSRFFFMDKQYDYMDLTPSDSFTLLQFPDRYRSYGATVRSRRGPLVGMSLAVRRTEIDFLDPNSTQELDQSERFAWNRGFGRCSHFLKLEHLARDFGTVDLEYDDLIGVLDERGRLSEKWDWDMTASAFRRDLVSDGFPSTRTYQGQFRNRFRRDLREGEWFDINQSSTRNQFGDSLTENSHNLTFSWNLPLNHVWILVPFANYSRLDSDQRQVNSPRLGISTTWRDQGEHVDGSITARASHGAVKTDTDLETNSQKTTALSISGFVGHGAAQRGLRKELLLEASRNELRLERELLTGLPDPALPLGGLGLQDMYRARLTLRHHWNSRQLSAWGEWRLRNLNDELSGDDSATETFYGTLEFNTRTLQVTADAIATAVDRQGGLDENVLSAGVRARWRPWRLVTLRGLYRRHQRNIVLSPEVDSDRYEVGVDIQLGQTILRTSYYEIRNYRDGGDAGARRNIVWSISRRFGGWLPVRTGRSRQGTIN